MTQKTRWDDLQFIYAVARHGSLSGAARELGVNHATALRRITAVEAIHGVKIFERPPGGYRVRPEGRDLLEALKTWVVQRTIWTGCCQRSDRDLRDRSGSPQQIRLRT